MQLPSVKHETGKVIAVAMLLGLLSGTGHAQPISPRALIEVVDFGPPVISADGRNVAFRVELASIERNVHDTVWYVQPLDGSSLPHRVADGGSPLRDSAGNAVATAAVWSADGAWIYYRALMEGRIDVWRAATDGSGSGPLTADSADVRSFSLDAGKPLLHYSVGGSRQQVSAAEQAEYDQGVRIDPYVPLGQGLVRSGLIEGRRATQRFSGQWFQRVPLLAEIPDRWSSLDLVTMQRRDSSQQEAAARIAASRFDHDLRDNATVYAVRDLDQRRIARIERIDNGAAHGHLTRLRVLSGQHSRRTIVCAAEACQGKLITAVAWRPHSDEVLFTVSEAGEGNAQSLFRWNVVTGVVRPLAGSRGHIGNGARYAPGFCAASAIALACVVAEADQPPRLERVDLESGERRVLFEPNAGLAQRIKATTRSRLLYWKDARGRALTGWYFPAMSRGAEPPPLFVTYYACEGFLRGGVGDEWPLVSFSGAGIAALCINQADDDGADAARRYDQGVAAVSSAIDLLAATGDVDRSRVGMGGLSFGSEVTLWTAANAPLLAAASISSPVISPLYYLLASLKGESFSDELNKTWQLRGLDQTPDRWKALSPTFKLDAITAPILFQASEQEYLHALDYAIPLMRRHQLDLYVFPDEPHIKFQPRHKLAVYERNIDWFRFWLQGEVDPAPGKAEQYSRWRRMATGR